jgi:hypothetical protein
MATEQGGQGGGFRLDRPEQCQKKNFFYLNIIETKEVDRYSAIVLKGYINHHTEVCPYDNCPIKAFKKMISRDKATAENDRKNRTNMGGGNNNGISNNKQTQSLENNSLLLAQAKAIYNNAIKRFPNFVSLRIDYSNFLQSKMKDRKGALSELSLAEKSKPGFDH